MFFSSLSFSSPQVPAQEDVSRINVKSICSSHIFMNYNMKWKKGECEYRGFIYWKRNKVKFHKSKLLRKVTSFCKRKIRRRDIRFMVIVNVACEINVISEYDSFHLYLIRQETQKRVKLLFVDFIFLQWLFCILSKLWSASIKVVKPHQRFKLGGSLWLLKYC
jgi:hypothetical protein